MRTFLSMIVVFVFTLAAVGAHKITDSHQTDTHGSQLIVSLQEANILESNRRAVPMTGNCLSENCPTEDDFCDGGDPACSDSPYQEPDGKVKPGVIAVFTVAGFLIVAAVFYMIQRINLNKQGKRYRTKFAQRIADTMTVRKSMRSLTPDLLAKEFEVIDQANDGRITKNELWDFL